MECEGEDGEEQKDGSEGSIVEENPFKPGKDLGRSPKKDAFEAMMSKTRGISGKKKSASWSDLSMKQVESPIKRRFELSPEKPAPKKSKTRNTTPLEIIMYDLLLIDRLVQEQTTVKREIKTGIKDVIRKFELVLKDQARNESHKKLSVYERDGLVFRKRIMEAGCDKDQIEKLSLEKWPPGAFINTRVSPKNNDKDESAIFSIIVYPEDYVKDKNFVTLAEKIPVAKQITPEDLKKLGSIIIEKDESTVIPGIESVSNRKTVHVIQAALLSDKGKIETADIINWVDCLKKKMLEAEKQRAIISIPEDIDLDHIRKIIESCLFESGLTVLIKPNKKIQRKSDKRTKKVKNETLIISGSENKSFADILKDVKANIDPSELGVEVKKIGKTKSGDLRFTLKEKIKGGNSDMLKKIRERVATDNNVRLIKSYKGFVLFDLEDDIVSSDVKEELTKQLGVDDTDIRINEIRRTNRGANMVTVSLPKEYADKAIEKRKIKIGWSMCSVREKFDPSLCQNCQCYGHVKKDCGEKEQKPKRCLQCGKFGHQSIECKGEEACFNCEIKGHRGNSMTCPVFRELVQKMKKNKNDQ